MPKPFQDKQSKAKLAFKANKEREMQMKKWAKHKTNLLKAKIDFQNLKSQMTKQKIHETRNFNNRKANSTVGPIRKKRNRMLYLRNKAQVAKEILELVSHLIKPWWTNQLQITQQSLGYHQLSGIIMVCRTFHQDQAPYLARTLWKWDQRKFWKWQLSQFQNRQENTLTSKPTTAAKRSKWWCQNTILPACVSQLVLKILQVWKLPITTLSRTSHFLTQPLVSHLELKDKIRFIKASSPATEDIQVYILLLRGQEAQINSEKHKQVKKMAKPGERNKCLHNSTLLTVHQSWTMTLRSPQKQLAQLSRKRNSP